MRELFCAPVQERSNVLNNRRSGSRSIRGASMEVRVSYVRRRLSRGVMYSSVARKQRSLSGTACGPSFTRFGSSIWTKSRPQTGAGITAILSAVCIAACGGKGSLLGSRVIANKKGSQCLSVLLSFLSD